MPTVMLDDQGSNPGVNHEFMYLFRPVSPSERVYSIKSNYVVNRQLGKKPVDVSVYLSIH
jgi:hypothetical protein